MDGGSFSDIITGLAGDYTQVVAAKAQQPIAPQPAYAPASTTVAPPLSAATKTALYVGGGLVLALVVAVVVMKAAKD